jgi:hypothetical protein
MDSASIITDLKNICDDGYAETSSLLQLYRHVNGYKAFIQKNTTDELYQSLCVELKCVINEHLYGDGEYTDHVFNDCIDALKKVVENMEK